jgi:hypothetical protein
MDAKEIKLHNLRVHLRACDDPNNGRDRKLNEQLRADILRDIAEIEGGHVPSAETESWRSQAKARLESVKL